MMNSPHSEVPASKAFGLRCRWDGPLSAEQFAQAQSAGIQLAYDPAQNGWVPLAAPDAQDDPDAPIWASLSPWVLQPWRASDLDHFHALLNDPGLWRYMVEDMPTPFTKSVAADLIAISNAGSHHEVRAILAPRVPAGQVRILWSVPDFQPDEAEISYWLGRSFRGKGLASGAVKQMVTHAFKSRRGLRRVVAYVHPENRASIRTIERAGFLPSAARSSDGWLGFAVNEPAIDQHFSTADHQTVSVPPRVNIGSAGSKFGRRERSSTTRVDDGHAHVGVERNRGPISVRT